MRKAMKVLGVAAAATGLTLTGVASANAINRVECTNSNYLWLSSNATTCWANAGTTNVYLEWVYGYSSGSNAGQVLAKGDPAGHTFIEKFAKGSAGNFRFPYYIYQVRIY